jgi:hypothetical protein
VGPLYAKQTTNYLFGFTFLQKVHKIFSAFYNNKSAFRTSSIVMKLLGLSKGSFSEAKQIVERLSLDQGKPKNAVTLISVSFNIQSPRRLGNNRECLQSNIPSQEFWHINLRYLFVRKQVTAP